MGLGDYTPGKSVVFNFNTHKADGTPITLAGTPAVSVYKNSTTESTSGVTLTVDYDSRTGMHHVVVDTSADGTFYAAGNDFTAVITAGTVDSISVVGSVVGSFSLSNRSALRPTTADRTLDVSAGGEAGLDWANVGSPTTSLALTGTTIATTQQVDVNTIKTQTITCSAGVTVSPFVGNATAAIVVDASGNANADVKEINNSTTTVTNVATIFNTDFSSLYDSTNKAFLAKIGNFAMGGSSLVVTYASSQDFTSTQKTSITTAATAATPTAAAVTGAVGSVTGNVGGNVTGSVGSVVGGINTGSGVITTLDALDTAQDTQHGTTQAAVAAIPTAAQNAAGLLDLANGVETGLTFRQAQKLMAAAAAGKLSGAATTTIVIRNAVADDKDRITATVDADGNRSAITLDLT